MGVPDTSKWKRVPGNFDVLKMGDLFPGDGKYGIPIVGGVVECQPEEFHLWTSRTKLDDTEVAEGAWHFFTDDYRFEPVWNQPKKYLDELGRAAAVLTPDFSLYLEWPRAAQIWNTYRGRWLGAFWESEGLSVIPTISWGDWSTFEFCFAGVCAGATVAVSTLGVPPDGEGKSRFILGYYAMLEAIQPSLVLVYGEQWDKLDIQSEVPVARYSPKGILEMRARLNSGVSVNQLDLPLITKYD